MTYEVYLVCLGNAASGRYDETLDIVHALTLLWQPIWYYPRI
jgi:hypothetical protein